MTSRLQRQKEELDEAITLLEGIVAQDELQRELRRYNSLPGGWRGVAEETPCTPPKERVTLRLDKDVLKYYRGLGNGYQARINAILRVYMTAEKAGEV